MYVVLFVFPFRAVQCGDSMHRNGTVQFRCILKSLPSFFNSEWPSTSMALLFYDSMILCCMTVDAVLWSKWWWKWLLTWRPLKGLANFLVELWLGGLRTGAPAREALYRGPGYGGFVAELCFSIVQNLLIKWLWNPGRMLASYRWTKAEQRWTQSPPDADG